MIDIKKFLTDILKDKIDEQISMSTGRQNEEIEKSIFIKNRTTNDRNTYYNQKYFKQNLSMTITWSDNYTETRENAIKVYDILCGINKVLYDENTLIIRCDMDNDYPVDVSSKKIYSQQIDFTIHYCIK